MAGTLKRYPNPARKGAFLRLSDSDAKRLGLLGQDVGPVRVPGSAAQDVTNAGGDGPVRSTTAGAPGAVSGDPGPPPGALAPGGPTHRARAEAEAASSPAAEGDEGDEEPQETPTKRATSTRRRRKPAEG